MIITKEGLVPTFKGTCFFCGCKVECDRSEGCIKYGPITTTLTVYCPTPGCGNTITAEAFYPRLASKKYRKE